MNPLRKRVKKSRLIGIAAIGTAALLVLSACSGTSGPGTSSSPVSGGNLTIARSDDVTSFLPSEVSANADIWTVQQIYEGLVANNSSGTGVVPALATKWSTSADGLSWTFDIRQGVKFQGGQDLTSADVVWSLNFARTESDATENWYSTYSPISNVTATDANTVQIQLSAPWPGLVSALGLYAAYIYPANFGGQTVDYMRTHPNGTGPFELKEWNQGVDVELAKNPNYWQAGKPYLDKVTFTNVQDDNTRLLQLQGKQIDVDEFPSSASMATISKTSGLVTKQFPSTALVYINLNNRLAQLSDPNVRRAMSYALDRSGIVNSVLSGLGTPANSFLSDTLFGWDKNVGGAKYDLDTAKKLMAASAYPNGFDLQLGVESGQTDREQIAEIAQEAWAPLGIKVTINQADWPTLKASRNNFSFQAMVAYATADYVDPTQMVTFLVANNSGIRSGYNNPSVNAEITQAQSAPVESDQLAKLLSSIQTTVAQDAPLIPVVYQSASYALNSSVKGFAVDPFGTYELVNTWIAK